MTRREHFEAMSDAELYALAARVVTPDQIHAVMRLLAVEALSGPNPDDSWTEASNDKA